MQLGDLGCFGHAEGPFVHVRSAGFGVELSLGLGELTQVCCGTAVIGGKKRIKVVNMELYSWR